MNWKFVSGYQKVDINRRIALVIEDNKIRDLLVERGLKVNEIDVTFAYHRRRDPLTRVYVSQLPTGILPAELKEAFAFFGDISEGNSITKIIQGCRIDTGDRVLVFKRLARHIPSYVFVRGWRAFVKHTGQPLTCRICRLTGHFAKYCPKSNKKSNTEDNRSENVPKGQSESQPSEKNHPENKSPDMSTGKPHVPEPASEANSPATMEAESVIPPPADFKTRNLQEIRDLYMNCFGSVGSALSEDREDDLVSVDSLNEDISDLIPPPDFPPKALDVLNVKSWEKLPEEIFTNDSVAKDLPQEKQAWGETEDREKSEVRVKPYCPQCRVDSHSEAECFASLIRQDNNKRKNSDAEDSKPGKSVRKKKNFKKFKHGIAQVVVEGKNTDDLQYVMEIDDNSHLFACYLLSIFGDLLKVTVPKVIAWQEMQK